MWPALPASSLQGKDCSEATDRYNPFAIPPSLLVMYIQPSKLLGFISNTLNFDQDIDQEVAHQRGSGRWLFGKILSIDLVETGKVFAIFEPHHRLDHVAEFATRLL